MQIVDEFGMEIGGGLVVRTPSGFAPKYSPGCPLGFRAMVATANETQQPYSVNRNTSQRLPSQRKRNSSLVHLSQCCRSPAWGPAQQPGTSCGRSYPRTAQNLPTDTPDPCARPDRAIEKTAVIRKESLKWLMGSHFCICD